VPHISGEFLKDKNGLVNAWRLHLHGLEATLERGVLLYIFAVFVECCRADALQFARERAGLMIFEASIAPSADPAPTIV
jgi:hypothetical protein